MAELFDKLPFENLYWNQMETLPPSELRELQTLRLRLAVERAKELPLYRDFFAKNPLSDADFQSPEDVRRLPLTTETQLLDQYPAGLWTVPRHEIARLYAQKNGLLTALTRQDVQTQADLTARLMYGTGTRSNHFVQISLNFDRAGAGFAYQAGIESIGAAAIPQGGENAEILSAPTDFLNSLNVNGICADTKCLADVFSGAGCQSLSLDYAHVPVGPEVLNRRGELEDRWNLKIWLNWSHPAFFGAGMANECYLRCGLHLQEDVFLFEILNPQTLECVEDGLPGELVVTDLTREAQTLLRFRTGLTAVINSAPCACGRTGRRVTFVSGQ